MKSKYILTMLFACFQLSSFALEVDSFTHRHVPLLDSLDKLDIYLNKALEDAIKEANHADDIFGNICHKGTLRRKVKKNLVASLRGLFVANPLQVYIDKGKLGDGYSVETKKSESVYQYIPLIYKPILKLTPYSPLILTNNAYIGSDKFSHMFNIGYLYYLKHIRHGQSVKEILKYGKRSESITWGGFFNGIISNGDLVANFQGLRFFMKLFGKGVDPLTGESYEGLAVIKCVQGEFKKVKEISFIDYVDDGMDEGLNCNSYTNGFMRKRIKKHLDNIGMECPVEPDRCEALGDKYEKYSKYLLHKDCR
ncbi:hypothetical protein [Halobacteriovorax sp. DPLXC-1]|uniref:hypothetical protein n=1 Tax=Halobacteriovorax sp. DPLXC-1 TaxID=3110771 RepID=UPI002FEE77B2